MISYEFKPVSEHKRHQKYLHAFELATVDHYYEIISQFVVDPNISFNNSDDLDLFVNFVFDSKFQYIHTGYCRFIINNKSEFSLLAITKFLDFQKIYCELFVYDFFSTLIRDYDITVIEKIFKLLSPNLKLDFLDVICKFPEVLKSSSQLNLYILFS